MLKKVLVLGLVGFGLATFFLPLVRLQAPTLGTQRISGWEAVKRSAEKSQQRSELGLRDALGKLPGVLGPEKRREPPLAVKQAYALGVTLPLAYLTLLGAGLLALLRRARALHFTAALGVLAGFYSLLSVIWLESGLKQMVAGGSREPVVGALRKGVAGRIEVSPELGLYLLAAALAALLLASFLPAGKR